MCFTLRSDPRAIVTVCSATQLQVLQALDSSFQDAGSDLGHDQPFSSVDVIHVPRYSLCRVHKPNSLVVQKLPTSLSSQEHGTHLLNQWLADVGLQLKGNKKYQLADGTGDLGLTPMGRRSLALATSALPLLFFAASALPTCLASANNTATTTTNSTTLLRWPHKRKDDLHSLQHSRFCIFMFFYFSRISGLQGFVLCMSPQS